MGRKKAPKKKPKPQRKRKKIKPVRRKPITRKPEVKRKPVKRKSVKRKSVKRKPTQEELLVEEARLSPGALEMEEILEREGELFVPVGPENNEGAAASSQSRQRSNVHQHLQKLDDEYGKWAAAEDAMSARDGIRSSRPQTPIGTFGDYIAEQEREDEKEKQMKNFLNKKAGTTYKTSEDHLPLNLFKGGGKRKSRRRKKSRRRRKTKRKSRRRRK